jgi:regulator of protease activity HflC (stomatin/prohibitin superfamily)
MCKAEHTVADNVTLSIDGVLYLRILNPYLASYGVEDPEFAITQLAQTTMRYVRNILQNMLVLHIVMYSVFLKKKLEFCSYFS